MRNNETIEVIERVKEYIKEHIKDEITLRELAQVAGYSMYHTSHIFKEIEGLAPFEYIRKQRLILSAFHYARKVLE